MMYHYRYRYHRKDSHCLYPIRDKQTSVYCGLEVLVIELHNYTKADDISNDH